MKNKIVVISFLAVIYALFFFNLFKSPDEYSASERRRLAQFPELSLETIADGRFMEDFDSFSIDQAAFREPFRRLKAFFDLNALRKMDNNDIFVVEGMVFKTYYPLNEPSILRLCKIINAVNSRYLNEAGNIWYTLVPDKNAYLENSSHLIFDYAKMETLIRATLDENMTYISIFGDLTLDCYFRTDSHWRQEKLFPVAETLASAMGVELNHKPFTEERFDAFYGVFYGQSALDIEPDNMIWLVSDTTKNAVVTNTEKGNQRFSVYDLSQLGEVDPYSIFMCGPAAVVTAQNPDNTSGRELIVFRDSFASSLTPLLIDAYSSITLIDLRYINPDMAGQMIDFTGADVLFIYSAGLFNAGDSVGGVSENFISPFSARSRMGQ